MRWTMAVMLVGLTGCQWATRADEAMHASHMAWYDAQDARNKLDGVLLIKAREMGDKKHAIQRAYTDEQLRNVQIRYPTTMPSEIAFKLLSEMRERDAELAKSEADWGAILAAWAEGNTLSVQAVERARTDDVSWQEFKRSAAAMRDSAARTLGGIAAGVISGLAVQ